MCAKHVGNQMRISINGLAATIAGGGTITHVPGFGESPQLDQFLYVRIFAEHSIHAFMFFVLAAQLEACARSVSSVWPQEPKVSRCQLGDINS